MRIDGSTARGLFSRQAPSCPRSNVEAYRYMKRLEIKMYFVPSRDGRTSRPPILTAPDNNTGSSENQEHTTIIRARETAAPPMEMVVGPT